MDTPHSILRLARRFFAGTLLSRVSGAMRDVAMAFCFGSTPEIAAFMVAYRLANLFRRLFGEGNLQASFIPHFESLAGKERFLFYRDTAFSLALLGIGAVGILEAGLWMGGHFLSPDWVGIAHLAMWMAPGLLFIFLYALNSAFLQTQKSFFAPAVAPVFFNIGWILAAFFAYSYPIETGVKVLALGVALAFSVQWAMTSWQTRKRLFEEISWREWVRPRVFSGEARKLFKPLSLGVIGVGAMQINGVLDAVFARLSDPSGPAFLWYAIRLEQLPLALFGIALSGAVLPPLARAMKEGNGARYRELLQNALGSSVALMIPCSFALFALGASGINLLYGRGHFSSADVLQTLYCLWGYAPGLIPSVFVLLLASGFFAQKSYGIPALASLAAVLFSVSLNVLFVFGFQWGAVSIALATSGAAYLNFWVLLSYSRKGGGAVFPSGFGSLVKRLLISAAFACALTLSVGHFLGDATYSAGFARSFFSQSMQFLALALTYLATFLGMAKRFKIEEIFFLLRTQKIG